MNLKDKYTEILAIFQNAKLPKDNIHLYLDELYKMAYNSISKIDDYYLHMELIDNQNAVLKKMKEYHLELLQYYKNMFSYKEKILAIRQEFIHYKMEFAKYKSIRKIPGTILSIEQQEIDEIIFENYGILAYHIITSNCEEFIRGIKKCCETLLMIEQFNR